MTSLSQQLRNVKEFSAIAVPLFFDFCFLTQSVCICSITFCEHIKVQQTYLLACFAASSRIHSEADISYIPLTTYSCNAPTFRVQNKLISLRKSC
ncbi:hypothetical protein RHMOL_Rhmol12G0091500 [Rhododendron molle]|uniref:Uncharacterized protein n=1 Tax=Rhododendron molle TaxID=49168 RepID=A0ACC0LGH9_RHOML|nr:hypothetical protein RHMOL_Rhmol12G0091500 [Rhododendron molle]